MKLLRKAQVGGLQGFILSIVTVAIVLAIGLIVVGEMRDAAKKLNVNSVSNESVTLTSYNGLVNQHGELFITATGCRNLSNSVALIMPHDCNVSSTGVVYTHPSNSSLLVGIDYSHYVASAAYNSTSSIIVKLATIPPWIGIVIIVALAFIVLSFFIGRRQ